jgi:hypothetical protein
MAKNLFSSSEGLHHFWSPKETERLTIRPGLNRVNEALYSKFAKQIAKHSTVKEVQELNDVAESLKEEPKPAESSEAKKRGRPKKELNEVI